MKMRHLAIAGLALTSGLTGCKKKEDKPAPPPPPALTPAPAPTPAPTAPPAATDPAPVTAGLSTPESVLYDATADRYLVSNINGGPLDVDDNGFIAAIAPDGTVTNAKWIDGAAADVTLNAPKGMAIVGNVLYVADITVVHKFDATSGKPLGDVKIDGAVFLNDMAATADGGVVVSDMSVDGTFASTGNDAIYKIGKDDKVTTVIKDKALAGPNGVWAAADGTIWVVTFGSGEIYSIDPAGKQVPGGKLPKGQLDGVVGLDGGDVLVSSWEGSAVYRGKPGGEWKAVAENVKAPADIGWDSKRSRLLIPLFMDSQVQIKTLK